MADITSRYDGYVAEEGLQNWRGDQVSVPQGGQSIYKNSSVPMARLGSRKVVGDRVFRYAKAGGTISAGDLCQMKALEAKQIALTAGAVAITGAKVLTLFASTNVASDAYAEGLIHVETGTAANMGYMYRIKTHASVASGTNGTFYLYDPVEQAIDTADLVTVTPNLYLDNLQCTGPSNVPTGVAPTAVTTNDYFWIQTWGPTAVKFSAGAPTIGEPAYVGATGAIRDPIATTAFNGTANAIGYTMYSCTGGDIGLAFLTIAP